MTKYEMPQPPDEPDVDRLWARDKETGEAVEIRNMRPGWRYPETPGVFDWRDVLAGGAVYDTHPDLAALEKYPAPWSASAAGTVRSANNKAVLDPTLQCPPCLTALIVRAVNELAERNAAAVGEDEKR